MAGLVPAIHVFIAAQKARRGCPAQGRARRVSLALIIVANISALGLEQRRDLGLRELGRDVIEERHGRERGPAALPPRIDREMLWPAATRVDRQETDGPGL